MKISGRSFWRLSIFCNVILPIVAEVYWRFHLPNYFTLKRKAGHWFKSFLSFYQTTQNFVTEQGRILIDSIFFFKKDTMQSVRTLISILLWIRRQYDCKCACSKHHSNFRVLQTRRLLDNIFSNFMKNIFFETNTIGYTSFWVNSGL